MAPRPRLLLTLKNNSLAATSVLQRKRAPSQLMELKAVREGEAVHQVAEGTDQLLALMAQGLSCANEQKQTRAIELHALMTGALVMARAAGMHPVCSVLSSVCLR
jgi:hypothetical protein